METYHSNLKPEILDWKREQYKMPARKRKATEMEENSGSDTNITTEDIAPDGDVIFEVGDETRRRLRVSSTILSMASPVFKTWLGPHFLEGQRSRDASNPVTIELPADQPQAMSDMFNLLHFRRVLELEYRNKSSDEESEHASRVLEFAIVANKYCCTEALYLQARGIMLYNRDFPATKTLPSHIDADRLTAAYLLNQGPLFRAISEDLILRSASPLTKLRSASHPDILPQGIFLVMNLRRNASFAHLAVDVESLCNLRCLQCDNKDYVHLLRHLIGGLDLAQWPIENEATGYSVLSIAEGLRKLHSLDIDKKSIICHRSGKYKYDIPREAFEDLGDNLERVTRGLCLRCVREKDVSEYVSGRCVDHKNT
ncbi:hypothetical protein AC578_7832 [Pseudocercospora eumusae]|uniref:BTB domain-containing protein n=1 Tax=Pseudocercospora eumusae TaxID=321146 RepID=A0A139HIT9_9PEZI|nr:hypothetical protein AC578_7832 [Pseudocercospora eumusae]